MDDMYIARVPIDQKRTVLDAQQEWQLAKLAWQEAKQEHEEAATDIRLAENERKQAKLEQSSVKERQKAAEKTGDLTQINQATLLQRSAKLSIQAADKKIQYMKARKAWKRAYVDYAEDQMYAKEAQFELAKARTAQNNNIQPRGFKPTDYARQSEQRSRHALRTKTKVDQAKAKADRLQKEWNKLDREAQAAAGQAGVNTAPEPLPPEPAGGAQPADGAVDVGGGSGGANNGGGGGNGGNTGGGGNGGQ
jgi:membrane protein involved in colicin uptake